jgi:hypothetical protein
MLDFVKTSSADFFALELDDVFIRVAEAAVRLVLFQNNFIAVNKNFDGVRAGYTKMLAYFLWYNYSSELIDIPDNTCRFHSPIPFSAILGIALYAHFTTFVIDCQDFFRFMP